jgi:threonine synthase
MQYRSTNKISPAVDFRQATINGQAPDKGLYFPETINHIPGTLINNIRSWSNEAICFEVIKKYTGDTIPPAKLQAIVEETINFSIPLVPVTKSIFSLELFHGPTMAFKDIGARFMSRCLGYFIREQKEIVVVLVATSGDTGGAVANGFYEVEGIEVVILYPSGKVSKVQEQQLTALGKNIHAIEVNGTFDDCQQMVKHAFSTKETYKHLLLTSANSINVARWLPQQFYYFLAYKQWEQDNPPVVSVPSGNFGNLCAGILAHQSGLPVAHFIAACNSNDTIPHFLETNEYISKPAVATISNAMDVSAPSNFIRILEIFNHDVKKLKEKLTAYSITEKQTKNTLNEVYKNGYLTDPHGAVGYKALELYLNDHPGLKGMFLETAHPVKFYDVVEPLIHEKIRLPLQISRLMDMESKKQLMENSPAALHEYLLHFNY